MDKDNPQNPDKAAEPAAPLEKDALAEAYPNPALEEIRVAVRGNGVNPRMVTVKKIEGKVVEFDVVLSLQLRQRTMEKIVGGKKTEGEKVDGPQGIREALDRDRLKTLASEDARKKVAAQISARKDKGFGTRNEIIKLPFLTKEYVHHQACRTCSAHGELKCQRCNGKGAELCPRCNGQSMEICSQCRGAQLIFNGNEKIPCPKCNGQGRTPCMMCHQTRKIQCGVCRGRGSTQCQNCNGQAWHSYITTAEMDVICTFDFDRQALPERLLKMVETKARDVPLYADIMIQPNKPQEKEGEQPASDVIPLRYHVRLPYAEVDFALGKAASISTFLLGRRAQIAEAPAFLEILLKDGIRALKEASEGRGNVAGKIQQAGQYRTVRHAIIATAKYSKGKAVKLVEKNSPLGITDTTIKSMVLNADRALKNITAKPRRNGMIAGTALAFVFYLFYMLAGMRTMFVASIENKMFHIPVDGIVLGAGMMFALLTIQFFGAHAMKKALGKMLPEDQKSMVMSKAGHNGPWSAIICFALFLAACEIVAHTSGAQAPDWYMMMRGAISK
ncbi:MAG: hypothetical protein KA155_09670 [Alphaproteobacteria bacterium]|nr:hypothetical protein [Alphaproteobacteria bacterium]